MGAATVLMAAGSEELPPNVGCIVSDCSFTAAKDIFRFQIGGMFRVPTAPIIKSLDKMYRKRTGLSFKDADVVSYVRRAKTPILFIHGSSDNIVPTYMVYELYNAASCPKEIEIIKGAGHGVSAYIDSETYWKSVFSFAERHEKYP
ncbi:MAG: alpha/beta hydrolase [Firmicutes bacterium]|nr:alpha/beta hydrolase [Bacillota bacterium]